MKNLYTIIIAFTAISAAPAYAWDNIAKKMTRGFPGTKPEVFYNNPYNNPREWFGHTSTPSSSKTSPFFSLFNNLCDGVEYVVRTVRGTGLVCSLLSIRFVLFCYGKAKETIDFTRNKKSQK
jgi:hypothetical protein